MLFRSMKLSITPPSTRYIDYGSTDYLLHCEPHTKFGRSNKNPHGSVDIAVRNNKLFKFFSAEENWTPSDSAIQKKLGKLDYSMMSDRLFAAFAYTLRRRLCGAYAAQIGMFVV